ncbi:MAG: carbohydrate porin [Janthinobacterium lividum]
MRRIFLTFTAMSLAVSAAAQSLDQATPTTNPATKAADTQSVQSRPPSTLTGEWGGLRTKLRDDGLDLTGSYGSESAWNAAGGERERLRETGQFVFGATLDTDKLIGLHGGTFQATITYRRGKDLGSDAGLGVLQQVQEVYGRGQTWRLTQFWYDQKFAGDHADIKVGRLTQGEDFASFSCQFMNLSFCGSPPGNLVGDYWYNWPVSQWGARLRVKNDSFYVMAGAYENNPRNLDNNFTLGHLHGATGFLLPVEVGYTPSVGVAKLPGSFKVGGWYNSSDGNDVQLDIDHQPVAVTGLSPLRRNSRYGVYAAAQQQLTGTAESGPTGPQTVHGLVVFANITQTDRQTSTTDNQIAVGLFYTGLIGFRPKDDFGLAVARTNVNGRATSEVTLIAPGAERPKAEYAAELDYGVHATDWLIVRPNVQYIVDPGGFSRANDVVVFGVKGAVTF